MFLGKSPMSVLVEKLAAIGGQGPFKARDWRTRHRLGWHDKAASTVRHMLEGIRKISVEEARQIEAAHFRYCVEKVRENHDENKRLFEAMRAALLTMETSDPDFYSAEIARVREVLLSRGAVVRQASGEV